MGVELGPRPYHPQLHPGKHVIPDIYILDTSIPHTM